MSEEPENDKIYSPVLEYSIYFIYFRSRKLGFYRFEQKPNKNSEQIIIEEKIQHSNGEIYIRKYLRGKQLGRGGFAKCYEMTDLQTKISLAAKIIPRDSLQKERQKQKVLELIF